jgi:hypothetical protein
MSGELLLACGGQLFHLTLHGVSAPAYDEVDLSNVRAEARIETGAFPPGSGLCDTSIHTIAFSPSFGADGSAENSTVFLSGWGIGVARSRDSGRSFEPIWDAYGADSPDAKVTLALSPNFAFVRTFRALKLPTE